MRDMVEIGMGRTARRTYELSDINIVPSRRTRSSKDVSTAWQLDAYRFEIPVIAHPTDALVSPEFAIELGRLGGLGVLNGEGLIGRHADVGAKIAEVIEAAEKEPEPSAAIRLLQQLHAAPLDPDLLGAAVARIRDAGVTTAVRVSPQNAQALTPTLVAAGIDLLVIQGTIISAERVATDGEPLNLKTFISELDVPVVAGGNRFRGIRFISASDPDQPQWGATAIRPEGLLLNPKVRELPALNENINISKIIRVHEGIHFEIRGEAFNAFNRVRMGVGNTNVTSTQFGKVTGVYNSPRQIQLGARFVF